MHLLVPIYNIILCSTKHRGTYIYITLYCYHDSVYLHHYTTVVSHRYIMRMRDLFDIAAAKRFRYILFVDIIYYVLRCSGADLQLHYLSSPMHRKL